MSIIPRPALPVKPRKPPVRAAIDFAWVSEPILPCVILRHGAAGLLLIHGTPYLCTPLGEYDQERGALVRGWRLTQSDGTVYDLDAASWSCDCPDATYRPEREGGCKHASNLRAALAGRGRELRRPEPTEEMLNAYKVSSHSNNLPF